MVRSNDRCPQTKKEVTGTQSKEGSGEFPKLSQEMAGQVKRQKVGLLENILYSFLVLFSGGGGGGVLGKRKLTALK